MRQGGEGGIGGRMSGWWGFLQIGILLGSYVHVTLILLTIVGNVGEWVGGVQVWIDDMGWVFIWV